MGTRAQNLDYYTISSNYQPIVFALVLALSFLVLLIAFRSIVIPAVAIVMNLLSVGAAYGLLTLVTQDGHGAALFGFQQVPVDRGLDPAVPVRGAVRTLDGLPRVPDVADPVSATTPPATRRGP